MSETSAFRPALERALSHSLAHLESLEHSPVAAGASLQTLPMAHVTALASARNALLTSRGWQVERDGLFGAPKIRILSSDQFHGSITRATRLLGMGTDAVTGLRTNQAGQLDAAILEQALRNSPDILTIVLLQAGDLNIGAYDCFADLIPLAHRYNAWVHVDGAFGLWANVSARYKHLLAGIEHADSWATDGHKWLNVP